MRRQAALSQKRFQQYNKIYVDKKRQKTTKYEKGDCEMVKNVDSHCGTPKKFKRPYRVSKLLRYDQFLLEDVEGFQFPRTPYKGVWSVANTRHWLKDLYNYSLFMLFLTSHSLLNIISFYVY